MNLRLRLVLTLVVLLVALAGLVRGAAAEPNTPAPDAQSAVTLSAVPQAEYDALVALFNATGGASWDHNSGWLTDPDVAIWYGVRVTNGHVVKLLLSANHLVGGIPPELGSLTNLTQLYLGENELSGTIPPELGDLTDLTELFLSGNQLTGCLPPELGNLTALTFLDLNQNQLGCSIPPELGNLTKLTRLNLWLNQLSGSIPPELGNLTALTQLCLWENQLGGSIPAELGSLTNLTELDLGWNQLSGSIPPELGNLTKLWNLDLSESQLTGSIPPQLGNLTKLTELDLGGNQLSGSIPPELGSLTILTHLHLGRNGLGGSIPLEVGNLTNLLSLDLSQNQLTGTIPSALGNLTHLRGLALCMNHLTDSIPSALGSLTDLLDLQLYANQLSGAIPSELGDLTELNGLDLQANALQGPVPAALTNLTQLVWISLGYNALYSDEPIVVAFLNGHDPDWSETQTVSPTVVSATEGLGQIDVSWQPIVYTAGEGYYEVGYSTDPGGPYTVHGHTENREGDHYSVTGLAPGKTYHMAVRSISLPDAWHWQQNWLTSTWSVEATATVEPFTFDCTSVTVVPCSECEALVALFNATNGGNWKVNTGWLTDPDIANWSDVTVAGGHVTELRLHNNGLVGSIPSELADLTGLQRLGLNSNELSGSIPKELGNLTNLTELILQDNQLSGTIPAELGNLASLTVLDLYANQLSGTIPPELGNLTNLQHLLLSTNQLSGTIPPQLGNLINLTKLFLPLNRLSGTIPPELGNLTNLQILSLNRNQLSGTIPSAVSNLASIKELAMEYNALDGPIPASITGLGGLTVAWVGHNQLWSHDAAVISFMASKDPDWAETQIVSPTMVSATSSIGGSIAVAWQPISYTADAGYYEVGYSSTPSGPYTVHGHTNSRADDSYSVDGLLLNETYYLVVRSVRLPDSAQQNRLTSTWSVGVTATLGFDCGNVSVIPCAECDALVALYDATDGDNWANNDGWLGDLDVHNWYGVVAAGGHVTEIGLDWNQLAGPIPYELGELTGLTNLQLDGNQLTGSIPPELGNLGNLESLSLYGNQLNGPIPVDLAGLTNLTALVLSDNQLSGSVPSELGGLSALTALELGWNQLDGGIPAELGDLTALTRLDLGENDFSGGIPSELAQLTALNELRLGGNQLSGEIPSGLGELTALTHLALYGNQLSGSIPPELGELTALISLELVENRLSGNIPPELGNLAGLIYLDLSWNQLGGSIPPELGSLAAVTWLDLSHNQLDGSIPPQLGNLTNLIYLYLGGNSLQGAVPISITDLVNLNVSDWASKYVSQQYARSGTGVRGLAAVRSAENLPEPPPGKSPDPADADSENDWTDLGHNGLWSDDPAVTAFLNDKDPDWGATQTVAPQNVTAVYTGSFSVQLTWEAIVYQADAGRYEVGVSSTPGGPYTLVGATGDKTSTAYTVDSLSPSKTWYLTVRSVTDAHGGMSAVTSGWGGEVTVSTNEPYAPYSTWIKAYGTRAGGWSDQNTYPRLMGDVNGDGKDDIVGFGQSAVVVSLSTGTGFQDGVNWLAYSFCRSTGWTSWDANPRFLADVNGDGLQDIVGFAQSDVMVALSTGGGFAVAQSWLHDSLCPSKGWTSWDVYPRLFGDLNGDGREDIVGFGYQAICVVLSNGYGFDPQEVWLWNSLCRIKGWSSQNIYPRMLGDVDGDGKADIVGFGQTSICVTRSLGDQLAAQEIWMQNGFCRVTGWSTQDRYPRFLQDVNADGRADIVGLGSKIIQGGLARDGYFEDRNTWGQRSFCHISGWSSQSLYPRAVADVTGDGRGDLVGFGATGVWVSAVVD